MVNGKKGVGWGTILGLVFVLGLLGVVGYFTFKTKGLGDNLFDFFEQSGKNPTTTTGTKLPLTAMKEAFETCSKEAKIDCLCNSGKIFDLPLGYDLTIKRRAINNQDNLELSYNDEEQIIENVAFCVLQSTDSKLNFDQRINLNFKNEITFTRPQDITYPVAVTKGSRIAFEFNPVKLFKHTENGKLYLCLTPTHFEIEDC